MPSSDDKYGLQKGYATRKPELCAEVRAKLAEMDPAVTPAMLRQAIEFIRWSPFEEILRECEGVIGQKGLKLSRDTRARIEGLRRSQAELDASLLVKAFAAKRSGKKYRWRIFDPERQTPADLLRAVARVGICTVTQARSGWARYEEAERDYARWLWLDARVGGTIIAFGEQRVYRAWRPKVFVKLFLIEDKNGRPALFLDTLESGDVGWSTMNNWVDAGRGPELLEALALPLHLCVQLGIPEFAAYGESEAKAVLRMCGYERQHLFPADTYISRKLGITPGGSGPYIYNLQDGDRAYAIHQPSRIRDDLASRVERVLALAGQSERLVRHQVYEFTTHLETMAELARRRNAPAVASRAEEARQRVLAQAGDRTSVFESILSIFK